MKKDRLFNGWSLAVILLTLVIISGGIIAFNDVHNNPGIEISPAPIKTIQGKIYVSGQVNNPGIYPVFDGDTFDNIIRAAGGVKDGADLRMIELSVATSDNGDVPQKININRAEAWLLEALPGIGEIKARAIIAYREQHNYYHDIQEILSVPGFSETTFKQIKDFITVYD
jgi:competence protein ComEA